MSPAFRTALAADAPALAAILRGWILQTPWMPKLHSPAEDAGFLAHLIAFHKVTLASISGQTAGFLAREGAEVSCLYLAPFARGQGLGTSMLERAQRDLDRLELWCFQANTGARRFYARSGFTEAALTDGARNEEKLPDVRLVWEREAA